MAVELHISMAASSLTFAMMRRFLTLSLLLIAAAAHADDPAANADPVQSVNVPGTKNPELRPYRAMLAGLDAFDAHHALAPKAPEVKFVLRARDGVTTLAGTSLRIAGGATAIAVPIAADGSFVLPRDQGAYDDDADLILNRKRGLFGGNADVHTPGLPDNVRRLGDLRLECEVMMAIAKKELSFLTRVAVNAMIGSEWCHVTKTWYSQHSPAALASATLVWGERRLDAQIGGQRTSYSVPLADASWPDDTLIELQFATAGDNRHFAAQPIYLSGSMNRWGDANVLRQLDANIYQADITLTRGTHEFKVFTKDFHTIDLGAASRGPLRLARRRVRWPGAGLTCRSRSSRMVPIASGSTWPIRRCQCFLCCGSNQRRPPLRIDWSAGARSTMRENSSRGNDDAKLAMWERPPPVSPMVALLFTGGSADECSRGGYGRLCAGVEIRRCRATGAYVARAAAAISRQGRWPDAVAPGVVLFLCEQSG